MALDQVWLGREGDSVIGISALLVEGGGREAGLRGDWQVGAIPPGGQQRGLSVTVWLGRGSSQHLRADSLPHYVGVTGHSSFSCNFKHFPPKRVTFLWFLSQ